MDHVFRDSFPYEVRGDLYMRNLARVAEAWLDEDGVTRFYEAIHTKRGSIKIGSLTAQRELQQRLHCHPFAWYREKFAHRSPVSKARDDN